MSRYILVTTFCVLATVSGAQTIAGSAVVDNPKSVHPSSVLLPKLELRGTAQMMFAALVREAGLPGGVAVLNEECSQGPERSISVPAGTSLDAALWQVAKSRTMSEWQIQDGVANMLPAGFVPPLLRVRIHRFEWERTAPVREVIDRLRQLPEVSEAALKLGLKEAPIEGAAGSICLRGCKEEVKSETAPELEEDATVLAVLNRIVKAHDRAIWTYSEYRCGRNTQFSLNVLAE
jgi:hypothetical protein